MENETRHMVSESLSCNGSVPLEPENYLATASLSNRTPTDEEESLSRILIEKVLPPFVKRIKVQALVVYQADKEKINCLLVDKEINKSPDPRCTKEVTKELAIDSERSSNFVDSGFAELSCSSTPDLLSSASIPDGLSGSSMPQLSQSGSRRKRKLCRPCKISQNGLTTLLKEEESISTVSERIQPSLHPIPSTSETVPPHGQNGVSPDSVFIPVTLIPRMNVLSLPVTVLSTLPRPILPRVTGQETQNIQSRNINLPFQNMVLQPAGIEPSISSEITVSETDATSSNVVPSPVVGPLPYSTNNYSHDSSFNRRFTKSFTCNQCHKQFASLNALCSHTFSVHRGFRCTICRAQFTQRSNLQRHSLRHVGFKPFVCKLCDKAYYRKDHLVRHIELSHPGCDPRVNLTAKLTSAECLDYLEQLYQQDMNAIQQAQPEFAHLTTESEANHKTESISLMTSDQCNSSPDPNFIQGV